MQEKANSNFQQKKKDMKAIGITKSLPVDDKNCFVSFETEKLTPEGRLCLNAVLVQLLR